MSSPRISGSPITLRRAPRYTPGESPIRPPPLQNPNVFARLDQDLEITA